MDNDWEPQSFRENRIKAGYNLDQLAWITGIDVELLEAYEEGIGQPSVEHAILLVFGAIPVVEEVAEKGISIDDNVWGLIEYLRPYALKGLAAEAAEEVLEKIRPVLRRRIELKSREWTS